MIERDGKFYWYVTVEHGTIHGKSIGVAVSDSPVGPFVDARGSALITNDMTTEFTKISWEDIDPTVFIDDDGQAYLYWGEYSMLLCQTEKNMIELDGPIVPVHLPPIYGKLRGYISVETGITFHMLLNFRKRYATP